MTKKASCFGCAMMGDNTYGYDYDSIGNRIQSAVAVGSLLRQGYGGQGGQQQF